jgi:hypothetical protein
LRWAGFIDPVVFPIDKVIDAIEENIHPIDEELNSGMQRRRLLENLHAER